MTVEARASNDVAVYLYDTNVGGIISYAVEENSVSRSGFGGLEYDELELLHLEGGSAFIAYYNLYGSSAATTAIWGRGGVDRFTIYDSKFDQLLLQGGLGSDTVVVNGPAPATILPNPVQYGMGLMLIDEAIVQYFEIEQLLADNLESLEYITPNPEDLLQLTEAGPAWHELSGSSGNVDLVSLLFRNVADVHLNLAANDQDAGDDSLAVLAGDLPAQGVDEVRVSSGTGDNQIGVRQGTLRLHASEGGYGVNTDVSVSNESLVQFGKSQHLRSLEVRNGGEVELIASPRDLVVQTATLNVGPAGNPDGTIQLNNHGLIINYVVASPIDTVEQAIEHAHLENKQFYWTGTGITSSLAAKSPDDYDVVAAEAADKLANGTGKFHGAELLNEKTAVLVEAVHLLSELNGDMDLDGDVDFDDIDAFVLGLTDPAAYEALYGAPSTHNGDIDMDGDLDFDDIKYFVEILTGGLLAGSHSASSATQSAAFENAVPLAPSEPELAEIWSPDQNWLLGDDEDVFV